MAPDLAPLLQPERLSAAARILAQAKVCDHCLGRLFGKVGSGATNPQRATALRDALQREATPVEACEVCQGLFAELDNLASLVTDAWAGIEFTTFLIGTRVDPDLQAAEQRLGVLASPAEAEPITAELNREIGKRVQALSGKDVNVKKPDVTAIVDTRFDVVELQIAPVFFYGRYRKFVRDIPQTRWPCRHCKGRGCVHCGLTGKQYPTSVQELVQAEAIGAYRAKDADFHGMGREDIDARCLGTGRPFILELKEPRVRAVDLHALEQAINAHGQHRVEVLGLRPSQRDEVAAIKAAESAKEYRAKVLFGAPVQEEALRKALEALRGVEVAQRTPQRVEHRRAMLTRTRSVLDVAVERFAPQEALVRIRGQAGLYIKELVSGDDGRTKPNLSEQLGVPARVTELDVVAVEELAPPAPPASAAAAPPGRAGR